MGRDLRKAKQPDQEAAKAAEARWKFKRTSMARTGRAAGGGSVNNSTDGQIKAGTDDLDYGAILRIAPRMKALFIQ